MIKAIFFDVGGVLASNIGPTSRFLAARLLGIAPKKLAGDFGTPLVWVAKGKLSEKAFWNRIAEKYRLSPLKTRRLLRFFTFRRFIFKRRVLQVARRLRENGYIVGILSDTIPTHERYHRRAGHYRGFHPIVLSCRAGAKKPEVKIYRIAAKLARVKFNEMAFMDDHQSHVVAAQRLGIKAFVYKNPTQLVRQLRRLGVKI